MHPSNTYQPSHIAPLAKIYGGTLESGDLLLFALFETFEVHRPLSVAPAFYHWHAGFTGTSSTLLDALTSLNPGLVMKTCTSFSFDSLSRGSSACYEVDPREHDPRFLVALMASVLASDVSRLTHLDWVNVLRTNVASLALRALASRDKQLRESALQCLFSLGHSMKVRLNLFPSMSATDVVCASTPIGRGFPRAR
jgi:nucleolar pre-ribosomal-associated protein 1